MRGIVPYDRVVLDLLGPPLRIHLVGIGGAGMSAIADVLTALGHEVSGSDGSAGPALDRLRAAGVRVQVGHSASSIDADMDVVGVSTAIPADNPEITVARSLGVPVCHRFDLLRAIGATRSTLAVSGTHGKTTTSALCALALDHAGMNPSFIIGADVPGLGGGARWTESPWLVLEADESDSTFLAPPRAGSIVTNIEADHLDHHGNLANLIDAFAEFAVGTDGPTVICVDDPIAAQLARDLARRPATADRLLTYGSSDEALLRIIDPVREQQGTAWGVTGGPLDGRRLTVELPGMHLVRNATAACALAVAVGAEPTDAIGGIGRYRGAARRYEFRGTSGGVTFIDDYAHLPTEVRAVMSAASTGESRVVCVFQPHRFSRTEAVWNDYGDAFDGADLLVVTEIYAAGESPRPGVTGRLIVDAVRSKRPDQQIEWLPTRRDLLDRLPELLQPGDVCLTLGAGDLTTLPDQLIERVANDH